MLVVLWLLLPVLLWAVTAGARHRTVLRRDRPAPRDLIRRALAVLPSQADQGALLRAISRVLDTDPRVDVLVVESSRVPAARVDRVSPRVTVLRQPDVDGSTEALRVGAARALCGDYDAVVELSVAHSRLARRITSLLEALDDGAHVAVGSRYVPGGRVIGCPYARRVASRGANAALRWITGVGVNDVTAHIRAYRRTAVEQALLHADGTPRAHGVDVMLRCRREGLRVTEVPVTAAGPMCTAVTAAGGRELLARAISARRAHPDMPPAARLIDLTDTTAAPAGR